MNGGLKIEGLARRTGVTAKAIELDRKLKDLLELRRRIQRSLTAWRHRPVAAAAVCPHIETPAARGRRKVARYSDG